MDGKMMAASPGLLTCYINEQGCERLTYPPGLQGLFKGMMQYALVGRKKKHNRGHGKLENECKNKYMCKLK